MANCKGRVESLFIGQSGTLAKESQETVIFALDGIVGDRHRGLERATWDSGDKQPAGVTRRNERHWSAVCAHEIAEISSTMGLSTPLQASTLGANLCLSGVPELSRLPKGTLLVFPSGAELLVEEYNPPCCDMGKSICARYETQDGAAPTTDAFLKAAHLKRGVVGVVDVPGNVSVGDEVSVKVYTHPKYLARTR